MLNRAIALGLVTSLAATVTVQREAHAQQVDPVTEPGDPAAAEPTVITGAPIAHLTPVEPGTYTLDDWPLATTVRPLSLGQGMWEVVGNIEMGFSESNAFQPTSLAPDIYYGVTDALTVGVTHSNRALSLIGAAGGGFCTTGESGFCPNAYRNLQVEGRYAFTLGPFDLAPNVGFWFPEVDPVLLQLRLGATGRWTFGSIALIVDPWVTVSLSNRDQNPELLNIPVFLSFQAAERLSIWIGTGFNTTLDDFNDAILIPLAIGAEFAITNWLDVGGSFGFPGAVGGDFATTDIRALSLYGAFRF